MQRRSVNTEAGKEDELHQRNGDGSNDDKLDGISGSFQSSCESRYGEGNNFQPVIEEVGVIATVWPQSYMSVMMQSCSNCGQENGDA